MGQQVLPPGFRFSPTEEELVVFFLRKKAFGKNFYQGVIAEVDVYKYEPWELPEKSLQKRGRDSEWYFFNAQEYKKKSHTARINRTTSKGYWKATGKDRNVCRGSCIVGVKKILVYYEGRGRSGRRTNWVMHEYRLDEDSEKKANQSVVLCRVHLKDGPVPILYENDETEAIDDVDEELPKSTDQSLDSNLPLEQLNRLEEILEEVSHLVAPSQGVVSNVELNERMMSQAPTNNHDISSPLDGFVQQHEAIHTVFPEGGMNTYRVSNDVGSQIARDTHKNGSGFVESSTRSFLSNKHMSRKKSEGFSPEEILEQMSQAPTNSIHDGDLGRLNTLMSLEEILEEEMPLEEILEEMADFVATDQGVVSKVELK